MAKLSWTSENTGRSYPFAARPTLAGTSVELPTEAFVDAGVVLGAKTGLASNTPVNLISIGYTGSTLTFTFLAGIYPIVFTRHAESPVGTTDFVNVNQDAGCGTAFLVTGHLSGLAELIGLDSLRTVDNGRLEQARVQSDAGACVLSLNFANDNEVAVTPCTDTSSSSGSPDVEEPTPVMLSGLTGDVQISAGYNVTASADVISESLRFATSPGINNGLPADGPCADVPRTPAGNTPVICNCADLISSIDGVGADSTGGIPVRGDIGVDVHVDPTDAHRLLVIVDANAVLKGGCA